MFDFTGEQEQQTRARGPVPTGSTVQVRMTVRKPKYEAAGMEYVAEARTGMFYLDVEYEVIAGDYTGVKIWERLFLPEILQEITMDKGQTTACRIAGAKLRAILEAARGIDPQDKSAAANRKRKVQSWLDFSGLEFPVVVGLEATPSQGKDGRVFWNNTVSRVVTPNMPKYRDVMAGGQHITNGPVSRDAGAGNGEPGFDEPRCEQLPLGSYSPDIPF